MGSSRPSRPRLTAEEREIRSGRGIPFSRWWPILAIFVLWIVASANPRVFEACLGHTLEGRGRAVALARLAAIGPCSPYLFRGPPVDWLLFLVKWAPVPYALLNWRWARRHKAYWDVIRARERVKGEEKRARRTAQEASSDDSSESLPS